MSKLKKQSCGSYWSIKRIDASIDKFYTPEGTKVFVNYYSSKEGAKKVVNDITNNGLLPMEKIISK